MSQINPRHGTLLPQDTDFDGGADQPGIAQPISQNEIEDLLYSSDRSLDERIARLEDMLAEAEARVSADIGGDDARRLADELRGAIGTLRGDGDAADETSDFAGLDGAYGVDPADHLDALSPDDEDARALIEGDDDDLEDDQDLEDLRALDEDEVDAESLHPAPGRA